MRRTRVKTVSPIYEVHIWAPRVVAQSGYQYGRPIDERLYI